MAAAKNFVSLLTFRRAANASRTCKAALWVLMYQGSHTQWRGTATLVFEHSRRHINLHSNAGIVAND